MRVEVNRHTPDPLHQKMLASSVELTLRRYQRTRDIARLDNAALLQWVKLLDAALDANNETQQATFSESPQESRAKSLSVLDAVLGALDFTILPNDNARDQLRILEQTTLRLSAGEQVSDELLSSLVLFARRYGRHYDYILVPEGKADARITHTWPKMLRLAFS